MSTVCAQIQIMWGEIAIIFSLLFAVSFFMGRYMLQKFKKLHSQFFSNQWDNLERKIERLLKWYDIISVAPWQKNGRLIYNTLCFLYASIALVNEEESKFIKGLEWVKRDEEFELKPFVLAMYYCAKGDEMASKEWNSRYLKCERKLENVKIIMDRLFAEEDITYSSEMIKNTISTFKNPAITKLLSEVEHRLLPPED